MSVLVTGRRLLARRRCIKELERLAAALSSIYSGTPFDMETPDGELSDEIGGEQLLEDMYMIQEEFVGGLSFWPHVDVRRLMAQIVAKAQVISDSLPPDYPLTKGKIDALIADMVDAEPRCAAWYRFGFNQVS